MRFTSLVISISMLVVTSMLSACTQSLYVQSTDEFAAGTKKAAEIAEEEVKSALQVRRTLGVLYYLQDQTKNKMFNIDPSDNKTINESFIRFVCAGKGVYEEQLAALGTLSQYADVLSRLAKTPEDKVGVLDRATTIKSLFQTEWPLKPYTGDEQYEKCVTDVQRFNLLTGRTLVPAPDEIGPAALVLIPLIYEAAQDALNKAGSIIESWARAKAIKSYVDANKKAVDDLLSGLLKDDWLGAAYNDRKQAALAGPYLRFSAMLKMPLRNDSDKSQVFREGVAIATDLDAYDALRNVEPGKTALKSASKAQKNLTRLASGDLSNEEAWLVFRTFVVDMKSLSDSISDASKRVKTVTSGG